MSSEPQGNAPFQMPKVFLGEMVQYWPGGLRETGRGEVGYVFGISDRTSRSVNIRLARGESKYGVRHLDDPRLHENDEMRAEGAWEHTDQRRQLDSLQGTVTELQSRLESLETQLGSSTKKSSK